VESSKSFEKWRFSSSFENAVLPAAAELAVGDLDEELASLIGR
jgi:hypothetical protein